MPAWGEIGRIRRQQVVNLSMTELMLLLVFMAVTFSFLSKEEDLREVSLIQVELEEQRALNTRLREQLAELQRERRQLIEERRDLLAKIAELQRRLDELLPDAPAPVPNSHPSVSATETIKHLEAKVKSLETTAGELQAEIARLQREKGGPGLPFCIVTSGYLLAFTLHEDGSISGTPAWDEGAEPVASALPGISLLASGRSLSESEFKAAASELNSWADAQPQPCRFRVRVRRDPSLTNITLYERQLRAIEVPFYVKRDR